MEMGDIEMASELCWDIVSDIVEFQGRVYSVRLQFGKYTGDSGC